MNFIVNNSHKKATTVETIHTSAPQPILKIVDDDIVPQSSEIVSSQQFNNNNNNINKDNQGIPSSTWALEDRLRIHKIGFDDRISASGQSISNESLNDNDMFKHKFKNNSSGLPNEWRPIVGARDDIERNPNILLREGMKKFKERLSNMSKIELLKLLKIVQDKIDMSVLSLNKRNVDKLEAEPTKILDVILKKNKENVVTRSEKMKQLMNNLEKIESVAPELDEKKLNKITKFEDDINSVVRIVKPDLLEAVTKKPLPSLASQSAISGSTSWRNEIVASLQPVESDWPQNQEVAIEDWPVVQPSAKPKRKKKKKRIVVTTTTTTTTTPAPVIIETTPTYIPPSSPAAFEEVWIEEEEDIVRPPRRKLKKYKKKTSPVSETTTTSTTTTTTTTTRAPTTTIAPEIVTEDWPNDDPWLKSSTKVPVINTWPEKQEIPEQQGKWPEEEWLNAVRDSVQNRYNIMFI